METPTGSFAASSAWTRSGKSKWPVTGMCPSTFGSITYTLFFSIDDPGKLLGQSKTYRQEEGLFVCDANDITELNEISTHITDAGGKVEKIESRYPSLEEMLLKIGK